MAVDYHWILKELQLLNRVYELKKEQHTEIQNGKLVKLDLSNLSLNELPHAVFGTIESLVELDLSGNKLHSLPRQIFDGLSNLESLNLAGNSLSALPKGIFHKLHKLRYLNLNGNNIGNVSRDAFSQCSIEELYLDSNEISDIHIETFKNLSTIKVLSIRNNKIDKLNSKLFTVMDRLERIYLSGNKLRSLPVGLFSKNSAIREIDLADNTLEKIDATIFPAENKLIKLWLQGNQLSEDTTQQAFTSLSRLEQLFLNDNKFLTIPEHLFSNLHNLQVLVLMNNNIQYIPPNAFSNLQNLKELWLMANELPEEQNRNFSGENDILQWHSVHNEKSQIHKVIANILQVSDKLATLQSVLQREQTQFDDTKCIALDLSNLQLQAVHTADFRPLHDLEKLNLSENLLEKIPHDFLQGMRKLVKFDISKNHIDYLHPDLFAHIELQYLNLEGNDLPISWNRKYDDAFELEVFLDTYPRDLKIYQQLQRVCQQIGRESHFTAIVDSPYTIIQDGRLISLDFSHLDLSKFKISYIADFTTLNILKLNNNKLTEYSLQIDAPMQSLRTIDLRINKFMNLPDSYFALIPGIDLLFLSDNPLTTIEEQAFESLHDLRELHLDGFLGVEFPKNLFNAIDKLEELYCSAGNLIYVPRECFMPLQKLKILDFSANQLTTFDFRILNRLRQLELLNLSRNSSLPEEFQYKFTKADLQALRKEMQEDY